MDKEWSLSKMKRPLHQERLYGFRGRIADCIQRCSTLSAFSRAVVDATRGDRPR